jgi:2-keto-4-pentenoate hydratase/2-oxohepta-3-ene-1,7-dioic acid hydratase in catechol pathway
MKLASVATEARSMVASFADEQHPVDLRSAYEALLRRKGSARASELAHAFFGHDVGQMVRVGEAADGAARAAEDFARAAGDRFELDPGSLRYLPPVCEPSKILCVGLNNPELYAAEGSVLPDHPSCFLKPPSSLTGHLQPVEVGGVGLVQPETELCLVIGRSCRSIGPEDWRKVVAGYTILNDITGAGMSYEDEIVVMVPRTSDGGKEPFRARPMGRYKGSDDFGPCGPWMVTADEVPDPNGGLRMRSWLDGSIAQDGKSDEYRFSVSDVLVWLSRFHTLEAGDLISLGTARSAPGLHLRSTDMSAGNEIVSEIDGIGVLRNPLTHEGLATRPRWIDGEE